MLLDLIVRQEFRGNLDPPTVGREEGSRGKCYAQRGAYLTRLEAGRLASLGPVYATQCLGALTTSAEQWEGAGSRKNTHVGGGREWSIKEPCSRKARAILKVKATDSYNHTNLPKTLCFAKRPSRGTLSVE